MSDKKLYLTPAISASYPYDPVLADHLAELKEVCREIGAIEMRVIRGVRAARIHYETNGQIGDLTMPESGVIFIARFTAMDGGGIGVE